VKSKSFVDSGWSIRCGPGLQQYLDVNLKTDRKLHNCFKTLGLKIAKLSANNCRERWRGSIGKDANEKSVSARK
jgi:hypothetical protein